MHKNAGNDHSSYWKRQIWLLQPSIGFAKNTFN